MLFAVSIKTLTAASLEMPAKNSWLPFKKNKLVGVCDKSVDVIKNKLVDVCDKPVDVIKNKLVGVCDKSVDVIKNKLVGVCDKIGLISGCFATEFFYTYIRETQTARNAKKVYYLNSLACFAEPSLCVSKKFRGQRLFFVFSQSAFNN